MNIVEATQPRIFHIHIDAQTMSKRLYDYAVNELKFYPSNFDGGPPESDSIEPQQHLSIKIKEKVNFEKTWNFLIDFINNDDLVGYLEGEFIPIDDFIPFKPYQDIPFPFKIKRRKLNGESELFRQTEIHIALEKDKSHPDLIKKFLDSGFYGSYIPKEHGIFLVLTMQGYIKDIKNIYNSTTNFLVKSGGAYLCTVKEERAIKHKIYNIKQEDLPEIADKITFF